jgi:hypothetical protein
LPRGLLWDDFNTIILFPFRRAINSRTGFGFPKDKPGFELKGWSMKQSVKIPFFEEDGVFVLGRKIESIN